MAACSAASSSAAGMPGSVSYRSGPISTSPRRAWRSGQAIGRWGNFFNEEAFGTPTNLPWKLYISPSARPVEYAQAEFFHPTFLYESCGTPSCSRCSIWVFRTRLERAPGALFLVYVGLYSVGRFMTEALRTDALMLGPIRIAQLVSLVGVAAAMIGVPWLMKRARQPRPRPIPTPMSACAKRPEPQPTGRGHLLK